MSPAPFEPSSYPKGRYPGTIAVSRRACVGTQSEVADKAALIRELARRIRDERVLAAIAAVPRDVFVPPELRHEAWENTSLPLGAGQTISQPYGVEIGRAHG